MFTHSTFLQEQRKTQENYTKFISRFLSFFKFISIHSFNLFFKITVIFHASQKYTAWKSKLGKTFSVLDFRDNSLLVLSVDSKCKFE